jgi:hypothetical protein
MTTEKFNAAALKTPEGTRELMASSASEKEWNANCDAVKAANGGYPDFWDKTIILSGLANQTAAKFKS